MLILSKDRSSLVDMTGNVLHVVSEGPPYPGYHIMDIHDIDLGKFNDRETIMLIYEQICNAYKKQDKNDTVYMMPMR